MSTAAPSILDLPFHCLPMQAVAQLATTCRQASSRARVDLYGRDFFWELHQYLCSLDEQRAVARVHRRLRSSQLWGVVDAVLRRCRPGLHTIALPPEDPVRMHVHSVTSFSDPSHVVSSFATVDVQDPARSLVGPGAPLAASVGEVTALLTARLSRMARDVVPTGRADAECMYELEWSTTLPSMILINSASRQLYLTPPLKADHRRAEPCTYVHAGEHLRLLERAVCTMVRAPPARAPRMALTAAARWPRSGRCSCPGASTCSS